MRQGRDVRERLFELKASSSIDRFRRYGGPGRGQGSVARAPKQKGRSLSDPCLPRFTVQRLRWKDEELGSIKLPKRAMRIRAGFGSGLATRAGEPSRLWAICDRGPNLKIKTAVAHYGLDSLAKLSGQSGAKIMPRLDLGPTIAELSITGDRVDLVRTIRISDEGGCPVSGLPVPEGAHAQCEPALDLAGNLLKPDPSGLDTEGIAALADGGFWVGDEFGPSLVRVDSSGRVLRRLVPEGIVLRGAAYPVKDSLPAIAAKRQLNRGFEAIALSSDERWLFLAFQSPLAHPAEEAHQRARHVRIWRLDLESEEVVAQYLYPLDVPSSFQRDCAKGAMDWSDLKVSELALLSPDMMLVLERGSETTKIYRVALRDELQLAGEHLSIATRPTVEEMSAEPAFALPVLEKQLVFTTDDAQQVAADLEGMAVLSETELLLVNDSDFSVEGAETSFWKVSLSRALA